MPNHARTIRNSTTATPAEASRGRRRAAVVTESGCLRGHPGRGTQGQAMADGSRRRRDATTTTLPVPLAPTPSVSAVASSKPVNGRLLPEVEPVPLVDAPPPLVTAPPLL